MAATKVVYCDGSCLYNGTPRARAGIGIYVPIDDISISEPLPKYIPPTNQTAELYAVIQTLSRFPNGKLKIYTDSTYVINCATKWIASWKKTSWMKKGTKKQIANLELIKDLDILLSSRVHKPIFVHVKGHSSHVFNDKADELARHGSTLALQLSPQ